MTRNIADIFVFNTPFEDNQILYDNFKKIKQMLQDYIINAWIPLEEKEILTNNYINYSFFNKELWIQINFWVKNDISIIDYFPCIILNYSLNEQVFSKENIEFFLNDNIKFIYNIFWENFFIDYDKKYELFDINKGKTINYDEFRNVDMSSISQKNKNIINNMMYLYFNLLENIFDINSNIDNINELLNKTNDASFLWNLSLFEERWTQTQKNLIKTSLKLKQQLDTFISLIK